ncbi:hypothetical protein [Nostoc flagelliforme]|uniref:hypothetical protein n=1 Tax=Nostoc flagelliforme TaxID=1306274 RepID=UPI0030DCF1F5
MPKQNDVSRHIVLTSHPSSFGPKRLFEKGWLEAQVRLRGAIAFGGIFATNCR